MHQQANMSATPAGTRYMKPEPMYWPTRGISLKQKILGQSIGDIVEAHCYVVITGESILMSKYIHT